MDNIFASIIIMAVPIVGLVIAVFGIYANIKNGDYKKHSRVKHG